MAILLTGGLGYIGSHIASQLKEKAIIIDNCSNSHLNFKKKLPLAKVYCNDLNYKNLDKIFSKHNIQGVIHLASLKAVGESTELPLLYYRNNVYSSLELLECMNKYKIQKLIFSSSATVYGDKAKSPLEESLDLKSTNPYGSTKIIIEDLISNYANSNKNFKSLSLRYFNPIGANLSAKLSESPLGEATNLMPVIIKAIKTKKELTIFGSDYKTSDGTCIRDYIHVNDVANAHIMALKNLKIGHKAINIGLGKGLSVLELINIFEKVNKVKVPFKFGKRRKGDVAACFASNKLAKKYLNWKPMYNYEQMCYDSWNANN